MRLVRIKDVAQRAGVSTTTVSNVLHGKLGKVSPEVAQRVSKLLTEMGYVPSLGARLLVRRKSPIIGVVVDYAPEGEVDTDRDRDTARVIACLEREISKRDHFMMLYNRHTVEEILQVSRAWKFAAVVSFGLEEEQTAAIRQGSEIPVVEIHSPAQRQHLLEKVRQAIAGLLQPEEAGTEP